MIGSRWRSGSGSGVGIFVVDVVSGLGGDGPTTCCSRDSSACCCCIPGGAILGVVDTSGSCTCLKSWDDGAGWGRVDVLVLSDKGDLMTLGLRGWNARAGDGSVVSPMDVDCREVPSPLFSGPGSGWSLARFGGVRCSPIVVVIDE